MRCHRDIPVFMPICFLAYLIFLWRCIVARPGNFFSVMSASHEKSPTETLLKYSTQNSSSRHLFLLCVWVPVCATLACWQVTSMTRRVLGQKPKGPCQVDHTNRAVGTNPPGLPSRDHGGRCEKTGKGSLPRIRSVGYSSTKSGTNSSSASSLQEQERQARLPPSPEDLLEHRDVVESMDRS